MNEEAMARFGPQHKKMICSSINTSDEVKIKPLLFAAVLTDLTYPTLKRKNGRGNRPTTATKLVVSIINIQEDKQTSRQQTVPREKTGRCPAAFIPLPSRGGA